MSSRKLLIISLSTHGVLWLIELGSDFSLSTRDSQLLFGIDVGQQVSHALIGAIFLGLPASGLLSILVGTYILAVKEKTPQKTLRPICQKCGYDLRATPQRCPECGTVPAQKTVDTK